jgi:hypothetical protein
MARRKAPEHSTITRHQTVAYSRKQKPGDKDDDKAEDKDKETSNADVAKAALAAMKDAAPKDPPKDPKDIKTDKFEKPEPPDRPTMPFDPRMLEQVRADVAKDKDAKDAPRSAAETTSMPMAGFGIPPEMPAPSSAGLVIKGGAVEDPTHMPGPRDIPPGNPDDVASPPGYVPAGDSRSLRRREASYEFALVYRQGNAVISRVGVVGTRGVWRVVEYPTTASASHAYAKECSRFVSEGFSDYRE